jgi:hypothetical protein
MDSQRDAGVFMAAPHTARTFASELTARLPQVCRRPCGVGLHLGALDRPIEAPCCVIARTLQISAAANNKLASRNLLPAVAAQGIALFMGGNGIGA